MPLTETVEADDALDQASSQGDTEPLAFDTEADAEGEMEEEQQDLEMLDANPSLVTLENMTAGESNQQFDSTTMTVAAASLGSQKLQATDMIDGRDEDAEVDFDVEEGLNEADPEEDGIGSYENDANGNDELTGSQATTGNISPSKSALGGANFSDESDLTDEPDDDDDENDEDAEGEDEEGEEEDGEEEDEDEGDEDEAAKGLAALTSGQAVSIDDDVLNNATSVQASTGLDGFAVIASAEAGEDSQGEEDTDNDSIAGSQLRFKSRKHPSAIPRRTATRLNEVIVASPQISEDDNEEEEEEEEEGEEGEEEEEDDEDDDDAAGSATLKNVIAPGKNSREMSSLLGLSSSARRNAKPGAAGLLAGAPSITVEGMNSGAPSAATSREVSPRLDDGEAIIAPEADEQKDLLEQERDEPGTPAQDLDEAQVEDEPTTDEASLRRQEAMEALTKIEIGFALLRDKLYIERMDEVSKEGEMILDGTHPDLIHLSNLIEVRRERKLSLVEKWFEQEEKQYDRVAKAEEAAAWNNWRNDVVELRKDQMNDAARKRRKLDREKRTLDGPRPARRHQVFETELVRNPVYDRKMRLQSLSNKKAKIRDDGYETGAFVAFPDLRGADDHESWMDMERMGIATDPRMAGMMGSGFYRPEEVGMDPYALYAIEQGPSGSSTGFDPYGAPPPPPADFVAYERVAYEGRGGQSQQQQQQQQQLQQHPYVDGYGRPLSPPPATHNYPNVAPLQQRGVNRGTDPYAQAEQSHHSHSYKPSAKGNRRSPHSAVDDRDVKQFGKMADSAPLVRQQHLNSPSTSYESVRPIPPSQAISSHPPTTHYTKHGTHISEEAFYETSSNNTPNIMKASSMTGVGPPSMSSRPKLGASGPEGASYLNRRPQEHLFPR